MFASDGLATPVFLHERSQRHEAAVAAGWLSIKSMWQGEAVYGLENGRLTLNNHHYLILNDQQPYTIEIDSEVVVESFCIFFPMQWATDVAQTLLLPTDRLLAGGGEKTAVFFYDLLHRHDQTVTPILQRLRAARQQKTADFNWQTEQLHQLLAAMLLVQRQVHQEIAKLPAARTTTRQELYRRLQVGREFMLDHVAEPLQLADIAQAAALSPYHFLRSFKQLFGQTPHAYLTAQRLQRAKKLLAQTSLPITEICSAVGFQSLGSFSSLFQRHNGRSPRAFRQLTQNKETR